MERKDGAGPAIEALALRGVELREWTSGDPFEEHPQLASIWPEPFDRFAQEGVSETMGLGGLYLAMRGARAIGITGFFTDGPLAEPLYLRWHGLDPAERGQGLSAPILRAVLELALPIHPEARELVELVPLCSYGEGIERHFVGLGFQKRGEPEFFDWSGMSWQAHALPIVPFMARMEGGGATRATTTPPRPPPKPR